MKPGAARMVGLAMIVVGLVALGLVGSYLGYRAQGRSSLDDLNFNVAEIERVAEPGADSDQSETAGSILGGADPPEHEAATTSSSDGESDEREITGSAPGGGSEESEVARSVPGDGGPEEQGHSGTDLYVSESTEMSGDADSDGAEHPELPSDDREAVADLDATSDDGQVSVLRTTSSRLAKIYAASYAGMEVHPKYWHEPLRAAADVRVAVGLPEGFEPASAHDSHRFSVPKTEARRLSIPSIGVDSDVKELAIVDLGSSRSYETPKNTIGHIPETADPGELGNGWFFGHLESPFRGEGNVFQRLPEIADLLRQFAEVGEGAVYVVVESDTGDYLYEVVATQVVHADELRLYDTDGVYITLVTCVPRLDYSHRLLVTAKLVGVGI